MQKAIVLFSGGLDSTTCLAIAQNDGFEPCALSFRYNQRHETELRAAKMILRRMNICTHLVLDLPMGKIGGSSLTSADMEIEKDRKTEGDQDIPNTYVPARNTIFLSCALGWAEDFVFVLCAIGHFLLHQTSINL